MAVFPIENGTEYQYFSRYRNSSIVTPLRESYKMSRAVGPQDKDENHYYKGSTAVSSGRGSGPRDHREINPISFQSHTCI